jgi:hypothetical protein
MRPLLRKPLLRCLISVGLTIIIGLAGWALLAPRIARHHALAVRRACERTNPALAFYYRAKAGPDEDTVAGGELRRVARRLRRDDAGIAAVAGWIERELGATGAIDRPPDEIATFLSAHSSDVESARAALLGIDPIRFRSPIDSELETLRTLLLGESLREAHADQSLEAMRDLSAAWRLARVRPRTSFGWRTAALVSATLRRQPEIRIEWSERLEPRLWRFGRADALAEGSAFTFEFAEDPSADWGRLGATRGPFDWLTDPAVSWRTTSEAKDLADLSLALRDERCLGLPLRADRTAREITLGLDILAAQAELTEKVAQLRLLRNGDGRWLERVAGIERSRIIGLMWHYEGGDRCTLVPEGPQADRLRPQECEPALGFESL